MTRDAPTILLALAMAAALMPGTARAHAPHDLAEVVALSPDFAEDQLALGFFVLVDRRLLGRSTDGGRTWSVWSPAPVQHRIAHFAFSPGRSKTASLFVAGEVLHRSDDFGATWAPLHDFDDPTNAIAVSAGFEANGVLVVAANGQGALLSADGGFGPGPGLVARLRPGGLTHAAHHPRRRGRRLRRAVAARRLPVHAQSVDRAGTPRHRTSHSLARERRAVRIALGAGSERRLPAREPCDGPDRNP